MALQALKANLFARLTGASSRAETPADPQPLQRLAVASVAPVVKSVPKPDKVTASRRGMTPERSDAIQHKRRNQIAAEEIAGPWIRALRGGHYAYRKLKDDFDAFCQASSVDVVSDHRFGRWLASHGGERYRAHVEGVTMYKMPRRRVATPSGVRAQASA
jgi:hypothetical protein